MAATVTALQEEFAFSRLVAVVAVLADKDVAAMLELLEPVVDAVVCTRNTSPRAMAADELGRPRGRGLRRGTGAGGGATCRTRSRSRSTLAETDVEGELAAVGVLITGSVVTVADARTLLVR